ncbi:TonB-dependent receptor [Henriciella pelagia]|jgi:iron complex outermembrane recepter protein|uniref:TonB-dependent receptor n=1 Tax=Henriciella pelagia TaxID=1977912 RepID=UPI001301C781|nr:TonB-dependent receptor [Henriciella pelagia]
MNNQRVIRDWKRHALCASALGLIFSHSAFAQDVSGPAADASPEEGEAVARLGQVVVTAQRREETAQNVPVSLTAVSGAELEAKAVTDLDELSQGIVGISYDNTSIATPELYIRGVGTNRRDIGSDPSSAVYVDDIYQPRFSNVLSGLVDLERVEVLRGPQGTLFGRNTIGGAISATTSAPSDEFEGRIYGTVGNKEHIAGGGSLSGPLSDRVRARLSGGYADEEGFMFDNVSGKDNGVRTYSVRGKIEFDLTDSLLFRLGANYTDTNQGGTFLHAANTPLFIASPFVPQATALDGDRYRGDYSLPGENDLQHQQIDARLIWSGDAVTATAITSWIGFEQTATQDLDATAFDIVTYEGVTDTDTYSAELRLASNDGGGATFGDRLSWVAGIYYFNDKGDEGATFTTGTDSIVSFLAANPTQTPPFSPGVLRKADQTNQTTDMTSVAVYGQGTLSLTDYLSLTLGARYTEDDRDYTHTSINGLPGVPLPVVPQSFSLPGNLKSNSFDPKVGLEFRPVDDVMFYTSYSEGFKSGAVQSTATTIQIAGRSADPETVKAYEVGMKSEFFSNRFRLNIAAFQNEFEDLQVRRVVVFPGGFSSAIIENAASSTIKGLEIETSAVLSPELQINASYAYLDASYDSYVVDANAGIDFSGNDLVRTPHHRYNLETIYTKAFGEAELQLRAAYNYIGEFYYQPANLPRDLEESHGLISASAQYTFPNGTTSIQLWGRNLGNEEYRTYSNLLDQQVTEGWSAKRTFGVTVSQRF